MVEAGAARCSAVVIKVADRDVEGAVNGKALPPGVRRVREPFELDKPIRVGGVVELDADFPVPIEGLDLEGKGGGGGRKGKERRVRVRFAAGSCCKVGLLSHRVPVRPHSGRGARHAWVRGVHGLRLHSDQLL